MSVEEYKLDCLLRLVEIVSQKLPKRAWLSRLALLELLNQYWLYTNASLLLHIESVNIKSASYDNPVSYERDLMQQDLDNKSHSCVVSCYGHMRICLDACKKLAEISINVATSDEQVERLQTFRAEYKNLANEIINARILINTHPMETNKFVAGFRSWGSDGIVHFQPVNLDTFMLGKDVELNPKYHVDQLQKFIKGLCNHMIECWDIKL